MPIKFSLKDILLKYGVTQKELSQNTGIRLPTISDICNNKIKQFPVSAMDAICDYLCCTPGDFIHYVPPNTIDMRKISTNTYNKLLLSKPFLGGIYKIEISQAPSFSQFFNTESLLCIVLSNSLSQPYINTSMVIPLAPVTKDIDLSTHQIVDILGIEYLAMCEIISNVDNSHLTDLCYFLSVEECINIKFKFSENFGLPNITIDTISKELIPYFEHLHTFKELFFKDSPIKNFI